MRLLFFGTYDAAAHPRVAVLRDGLAGPRRHGAGVQRAPRPVDRRPGVDAAPAVDAAAAGLAAAGLLERAGRPLAAVAPGRQLAGRGGRRLPRSLRRAAGPAAVPARAGRPRPPDRRQRHGHRPRRVGRAAATAAAPAGRGSARQRRRRRRRHRRAPRRPARLPTAAGRWWCPSAHPSPGTPVAAAPGDRRCRPADAGGVLRPLHPAAGRPRDRGRAGRARRRRAPGRGDDGRRRPGPRRDPVAGRRQPPGARGSTGSTPPTCRRVVAEHDVCLGIFGTGPKALRVVPNKVFQGAAAGCAVVTSDTAPQRRLLGDAAVLVPPGDPAALAGGAARPRRRPRPAGAQPARRAAGLARSSFTPAAVTAPLLDAPARRRTPEAPDMTAATPRAVAPPAEPERLAALGGGVPAAAARAAGRARDGLRAGRLRRPAGAALPLRRRRAGRGLLRRRAGRGSRRPVGGGEVRQGDLSVVERGRAVRPGGRVRGDRAHRGRRRVRSPTGRRTCGPAAGCCCRRRPGRSGSDPPTRWSGHFRRYDPPVLRSGWPAPG